MRLTSPFWNLSYLSISCFRRNPSKLLNKSHKTEPQSYARSPALPLHQQHSHLHPLGHPPARTASQQHTACQNSVTFKIPSNQSHSTDQQTAAPHRGEQLWAIPELRTQLHDSGAWRADRVLHTELQLGMEALLALTRSVVGGIALLHLHLPLPADDVAVEAFLQVVPVVRVVQVGAGRAQRRAVPGAVLCHECPRRALLAGDLLLGRSISPLVRGWGGAAQLCQQQEERSKRPL